MDATRRRLLQVIQHRYDSVAHTHKTHEKERELVAKRIACEKRLRLLLTILNAVFIGEGVFVAAGVNFNLTTIIAGLTMIIAGISALVAIHKLTSTSGSSVHSHKLAAKSLLKERNQLFHLIEECMSSDYENAEIRAKLDAIEQRLNAFDPLLPDTSRKAYELARSALATGGEGVSARCDVDKLLPESMRDGETEDTNTDSSDESDDTDLSRLID